MPEIAEPNLPFIIKSTYNSLDMLLSQSSILPSEFFQGRSDLNKYEKNSLAYAGSDAIWQQIKFYLEELKAWDPDNFKRNVSALVQKNDDLIFQALKDDILNYIKLH